MRVACVQLNTQEDKAASVATAVELVNRLAAAGARLVVLPETWTYKGRHAALVSEAEAIDGPSNTALAEVAARHGIYVLAGSIYERTATPGMYSNTSVLFGPGGDQLAVYRKIHLFDAVTDAATYCESDDIIPGSQVVTAVIDGVTVGLTICYDLRFPELYRALALRGAHLILLPSAFTALTGAAHWEVLVRARAIENGVFIAAADQTGPHPPDRECYGHSMIVDPWGTVLAVAAGGVGECSADVDLEAVDHVRRQVPALENRRPETYGL
jgi:predicted amidohydrolase